MRATLLLVLFVATIICVSGAASALSYSVTVRTDVTSYVGAATVYVSGQVSPAPGPNTAVLVRVCPTICLSNNTNAVTAGEANVNGTTGLYTFSFVAGGSSRWTGGNYVVNATWGAYGSPIFAIASFSWSLTAVTTSTSISTSTTTTSSTSPITTTSTSASTSTSTSTSETTAQSSTPSSSTSSTTSSTSSSSSTTSSGGGGIPEFPYQALAVGVFTVLLVASYLLLRRHQNY